MVNTYEWTDNPTVSGVSVYDPDVLNDCLMHLKYDVSNEFDGKIATCSKNDFTNITSVAKSMVAELSAPSEKCVTLSAGASGSTYTAPANGWFRANGTSTAQGHLSIFRSSDDFSLNIAVAWGAGMALVSACPVKKGQVVTLGYSNASITEFKFFYAEGDTPTESEV